MFQCKDMRGYSYESDFKIRYFWVSYQGYSKVDKINLMYLPMWQYSSANPVPKDPYTVNIWDGEFKQISIQAMLRSEMVSIKMDDLMTLYPEESALKEHQERVRLAERRIFKLSRLQGRNESITVAAQIRVGFVTNFNPSEIVFQALQYTDFLQDAYFWLELTIKDYLSLNNNLQLLCDSTQRANKARGKDPEEYDRQLEIRQSALLALGIVNQAD